MKGATKYTHLVDQVRLLLGVVDVDVVVCGVFLWPFFFVAE